MRILLIFYVFTFLYCSNSLSIDRLESLEQKVQEQLLQHPDELNLSTVAIGILAPQEITIILSQLSPQQRQAVNKLVLFGQQLREMPMVVFGFTGLQHLNLAWNALSEIPPEIEQLNHLVKLDLEGNTIKIFPRSMRHLSALQSLNLAGNSLEFVPEEVWQLTSLVHLFLNINFLTKISKKIGRLTNLAILRLHDNKLQKLPREITRLDQLFALSLSNNQLQKLPAGMEHLAHTLHTLNITNNEPPFSEVYKAEIRSLLPATTVVF